MIRNLEIEIRATVSDDKLEDLTNLYGQGDTLKSLEINTGSYESYSNGTVSMHKTGESDIIVAVSSVMGVRRVLETIGAVNQ